MWQTVKMQFLSKKKLFTPKILLGIVLGTAIGSFGIYNIHQQTGITEGGIIGLILLLHHWTNASPSLLSPLLDGLSYLVAFRYLGRDFLCISILSSVSLAGFFRLWEQFPPLLPNLSAYPFFAAVLGAIFVGVGAGLVIRQGGAGSGDDALALAISKVSGLRISVAYLSTDLSVLLLSLSYIPFERIIYSLITVSISSPLIDWIQNVGKSKCDTAQQPS